MMIRMAFVGKGGAGKSSIAGTVARLLARAGHAVVALDSDPLPGLSYALGIPVDDRPIPDETVVEGPEDGPRWVLRPGLGAERFVDTYAVKSADGVRYLQFGNLWGGVWTLQRAQFAWSQVVRELPEDRFDIVGDLPGGTRQAMFGWARYADVVAVVVEPTTKSLHTARRLLNLSAASWAPDHVVLVANKVRDRDDVARIAARLDRPVVAAVPASPTVVAADRAGVAPLDADARGSFVSGCLEVVESVGAIYRSTKEVPS